MLLSLLQVVAVTLIMGVGAKSPTPNNLEQEKETPQLNLKLNRNTYNENENTTNNNVDYSISHEYTMYGYTNTASVTPTSTHYYTSEGVSQYGIKEVSAYYNARFYNEYLNVQSYLVDQTLTMLDSSHSAARQACIDTDAEYGETTSMYKLAINTYGNTINNEFTLDFKLIFRVGWGSLGVSNPNHLRYKISTYSTNDSYASQYLDQANWYLYRQNAHIWAALTESGFYNYQLVEYDTDPIVVNENTQTTAPQITYTGRVSIIPNQINYVYIYLRPYVTDASISGYLFMNQQTPDNYLNFFAGSRSITFNGTAIPASQYTEVIDLPGLMWEILAMPFAFISQAFNLTLFPGTQYQINISNILLMIFGILVFLFIFKLLLRK